MTDQSENLDRVRAVIADTVRAFVADVATLRPPRFIGPDLAHYVERCHGRVAAESALRIMRDLRGVELGYDVTCVDRAGSVYEVSPVGPVTSPNSPPLIGNGAGSAGGRCGLGTDAGNGAGSDRARAPVVDPRQDGDGGAAPDCDQLDLGGLLQALR